MINYHIIIINPTRVLLSEILNEDFTTAIFNFLAKLSGCQNLPTNLPILNVNFYKSHNSKFKYWWFY
jgi:hypothetical protein